MELDRALDYLEGVVKDGAFQSKKLGDAVLALTAATGLQPTGVAFAYGSWVPSPLLATDIRRWRAALLPRREDFHHGGKRSILDLRAILADNKKGHPTEPNRCADIEGVSETIRRRGSWKGVDTRIRGHWSKSCVGSARLSVEIGLYEIGNPFPIRVFQTLPDSNAIPLRAVSTDQVGPGTYQILHEAVEGTKETALLSFAPEFFSAGEEFEFQIHHEGVSTSPISCWYLLSNDLGLNEELEYATAEIETDVPIDSSSLFVVEVDVRNAEPEGNVPFQYIQNPSKNGIAIVLSDDAKKLTIAIQRKLQPDRALAVFFGSTTPD